MGFTAITQAEIAAGQPVTQALMQKVKDNDDYLYSQVGAGGGGGAGLGVPNGSFEIDADADGVPDGWTKNLYPAGGGAIETTAPGHGAQAYKFTQQAGPGNGGGYLDMSDYLPCTPVSCLTLEWLHYASVAGMHNIVQVRWFDKAKVYLSSTDIYNSTNNPTSWERLKYVVLPPSSARFWKLRLIGGYTDTDIAGVAYFDRVTAYEMAITPVYWYWSISEQSISGTSWEVLVSKPNLWIPGGAYELIIPGLIKTQAAGIGTFVRFKISTVYSNEVSEDTEWQTYVPCENRIKVVSFQGTSVTLDCEGRLDSGGPYTGYYNRDGTVDYATRFV